MKTKETPFLDFYNKSVALQRMPCNGLCSMFRDHEQFKLIDPEEGDHISYWGADDEDDEFRRWYEFTELRQTIVLFCATMNNEL
jgi:hypothetical protein